MTWWKELASTIESFITAIGIFVAGVWTYMIFIRKRQAYPRAALTILVDNIPIPDEGRLVHVEMRIENLSDVVLRASAADLRLRQVVPLPADTSGSVLANQDPVPFGRAEVEWPLVASREWQFDNGDFEIEPGESDSLHADFMIDSLIAVVQFYFYLSNAAKAKSGLGWTITKMHVFGTPEEEDTMTDKKSQATCPSTRQQKQQKPQIQQPQQPQQTPKQKPKEKK
ncbi:hypothetical protein JW916_03625 [Candidatus Sumerlaeota bacterium]|nr:hypothetical protein [Candidatus Sumerlaeota bacterium]